MSKQSSSPVIRACVLAAGASSRFGASKLIQDLRGKALVQHALHAAQEACRGLVTLVVGNDDQNVAAAAGNLSNQVIFNSQYAQGIGTSIATGVAALQDGSDAIIVLLADQPLVTAAHLNEIRRAWSGADDEIVATSFKGVNCPPVLFPRNTFAALCKLSGDHGARSLLSGSEFTVKSIEFAAAGIDVDTPQDLEALRRD